MKNGFLVAGLCLLLTNLAFGQQWQSAASSYVGFEFIVGDTVLPAGTYSVSTQVGHDVSRLMIRNIETGKGVFANTSDLSLSRPSLIENSNFVFVRDGDGRYFLHQVWLSGDTHGHDLLHKAGLAEPS